MEDYKAAIIDNTGNIEKISSPNGENHATVLGEYGRKKISQRSNFS